MASRAPLPCPLGLINRYVLGLMPSDDVMLVHWQQGSTDMYKSRLNCEKKLCWER
jgi:hypothetical protein